MENSTSSEVNFSTGFSFDPEITYPIILSNVIICGTSLVGNISIIVMICKRRLLGRTTNVFVFSFAIADSLSCCGAIPFNVSVYLDKSMSVFLCKGYQYCNCISRTAISYTIALLTTEKVLNILQPTRIITAGRCLFFISLVWFFSAAFNVWATVFYTVETIPLLTDEYLDENKIFASGKVCYFSNRFENLRHIFEITDLSVRFAVPVCIVLIQFVFILRKLHGSLKQRIETYLFIMKFLLLILLVFLLCHTPFEIGSILRNRKRIPSKDIVFFFDLSTLIYHCRGVLNLFIYCYFKQYVCKRRKISTAHSSKANIELRPMRTYRGASINDTRVIRG